MPQTGVHFCDTGAAVQVSPLVVSCTIIANIVSAVRSTNRFVSKSPQVWLSMTERGGIKARVSGPSADL